MDAMAAVVMVALTATMLTLLGLGAAARGTTRLALGTVAALALWLCVAALASSSGALSNFTAVPPRWPLFPLATFVAMFLVLRTARAKAIIAQVPAVWPIAAQTFRVGVELGLYTLHEARLAPVQITFAGRNFDIVVGLSAPIVAWLLATRRIGPRLAVAWNLLGLAILANTVVTVATSTPGPLHLDWPGAPFTAIATWPMIWLPAFLMPLAVFFHIVSLRQNLQKGNAG